ncbi:hypothetical protein [Halomonas sp. SpR8]|uniref:hypothetical protein n=1 Tax=Halomonas sp. SpR8 TaxID=3050463 RepID=UPI0027E42BB0|nr:hypothetical protein [Halomonas sp. SpR8]MDQ7728533.1 hypothetical protein [Halomonas sp. SpR8]
MRGTEQTGITECLSGISYHRRGECIEGIGFLREDCLILSWRMKAPIGLAGLNSVVFHAQALCLLDDTRQGLLVSTR